MQSEAIGKNAEDRKRPPAPSSTNPSAPSSPLVPAGTKKSTPGKPRDAKKAPGKGEDKAEQEISLIHPPIFKYVPSQEYLTSLITRAADGKL